MTFDDWFAEVDRLGIAARLFDPPTARFICGTPRRPYWGTDGVWFELWASGVPPAMALGEAMVEQEGG